MSGVGSDREEKNVQWYKWYVSGEHQRRYHHYRKRTFANRRSSILKTRMDNEREALSNLDTNKSSASNIRLSDRLKVDSSVKRRVSFAETYIVKEFPRDSPQRWLHDETDISTSEEDTGTLTVTESGTYNISGLQQLLTAPIQTYPNLEEPEDPHPSPTFEPSVCENDGVNQTQYDSRMMDMTGMTTYDQSFLDQRSPVDSGDKQLTEELTEDFTESKIPTLYVPEKKQYSSNAKYVGLYNVSDQNDCATLLNTSVNKYSGIQGRTLALVDDMEGVSATNCNVSSSLPDGVEVKKIDGGAFLKNLKNATDGNTHTSPENMSVGPKVDALSFLQKVRASTDGLRDNFVSKKLIGDVKVEDSISQGHYQIDDEEMEFTGCLAENILSDQDKENHEIELKKTGYNLGFNRKDTENVQSTSGFVNSSGKENIKKKGLRERDSLSESFNFGQASGEIVAPSNDARLPSDGHHIAHNAEITQRFSGMCPEADMEFTRCLGNDSEKPEVTLKFSELDADMELTKCLGNVTQKTEVTQRFLGMEQDANMEFTKCIGNETYKPEMTQKFSEMDCGADMEFTICVGNDAQKLEITKMFSKMDQGSDMEITKCVRNETENTEMTLGVSKINPTSVEMELPKCVGDEMQKIDLTQRFSGMDRGANMEFTKCIENDTQKPDKTQTFSGMDRGANMEFTKCIGNDTQKRDRTQKFTGTDKDAGMEFTKCIGNDTQKLDRTQKFTGTDKDAGMEFTKCIGNDTQKLDRTQKFTGTDRDADMEFTKCIGNDSEKLDKTQRFSGMDRGADMEFTKCIGNDSEKLDKTQRFSGMDRGSDMEFTKCIGNDSQKLDKTQRFSGMDKAADMELTKCIGNDSQKLDKTQRLSGLDRGADMEFTKCIGNDTQKLDRTQKFTGTDRDADMEFTKCIGNDTQKLDRTQKFTGTDKDADMEFTKCIGNDTQKQDRTQMFTGTDRDADMEFTKCIGNDTQKQDRTQKFTGTDGDADMEFTKCIGSDSKTLKSDLVERFAGTNFDAKMESTKCMSNNSLNSELTQRYSGTESGADTLKTNITQQCSGKESESDIELKQFFGVDNKSDETCQFSGTDSSADMKFTKCVGSKSGVAHKISEIDTNAVMEFKECPDSETVTGSNFNILQKTYGIDTDTSKSCSKSESAKTSIGHSSYINAQSHSLSTVNLKRKFHQLDSLITGTKLQTGKRSHVLSDLLADSLPVAEFNTPSKNKKMSIISHGNEEKDLNVANNENEKVDPIKPSECREYKNLPQETTERTGCEKTVTFDMTVNLTNTFTSNICDKLAKARNSVGLYKLKKERLANDDNLTGIMDISLSDLPLVDELESGDVDNGNRNAVSDQQPSRINNLVDIHSVDPATSPFQPESEIVSMSKEEKRLALSEVERTVAHVDDTSVKKEHEIKDDGGESSSPDCSEPLPKKYKMGYDVSILSASAASSSAASISLTSQMDDLSNLSKDTLNISKFSGLKGSIRINEDSVLSVLSRLDENTTSTFRSDLRKKLTWTLDDFYKFVGFMFCGIKKSSNRRRSSFVPKALKPINKLSEIITVMTVKKTKFIHDQESLTSLIKEQDSMEEELKDFEERLLISSPKLFLAVRNATDEEVDELKIQIEDRKAACRKLTKKWWKEKRSVALNKTLCDLRDHYAKITSDVQDMLNTLEEATNYCSELDEVNKLLDQELENLCDIQEISDENVAALKEVSQQISTMSTELEKKEKKVVTLTEAKKKLEHKRDRLSEAVFNQDREKKELNRSENLVSHEQYKTVIKEIDLLQSIHEWHITDFEDSRRSLSFLFLYDIFRLDVEFQENSIGSASVLSINLVEKPTAKLKPWHQIARNFIKHSVTEEQIRLQCQYFTDLPKVMRWISKKVTEARCLARDVGYASFDYKIAVDNFSVSLEVLNRITVTKYILNVIVDPDEYPHKQAAFSIKQIIGNIDEECLLEKMKQVPTGHKYFSRLLSIL